MADSTAYIERVRRIKRTAKQRFYPCDNLEFKRIQDGRWKLDVWENGINSHAIFDLEKDYTDEAIERKFKALEVSREEYLKNW